MIKLVSLFAFLATACAARIQEPYSVAWRETADVGGIHAQLMLQRSDTVSPYTAADLTLFVSTLLDEADAQFGPSDDAHAGLSDVTVLVVADDSSQWDAICGDHTGDPWHIDGCSMHGPYLFPQPETGRWQIAIRESVIASDPSVVAHELAHGYLEFRNGVGDPDHVTAGVWERFDPSLVLRVTQDLAQVR